MKCAYHVGDILEPACLPKSHAQKCVVIAITLRIGQKKPKPNIFVQLLAKDQLIVVHHPDLIKGWKVHGRIGGSIWQEKSREWIQQVIRKEQVAYASLQKTTKKKTQPKCEYHFFHADCSFSS